MGLEELTGCLAVSFVADRRSIGSSKYSIRRMLRLGLQGITSFSSLPLRLAGLLGFIAAASMLPYALWGIYARFFTDNTVSGWTSLLVIVVFLGGVQLISLGVLG